MAVIYNAEKENTKKSEVKEQVCLDHLPKIKGYDFEGELDYKELLKSFAQTGFQAAHFGKAVQVVNQMIEEEAHIFLGFTSNMISSGVRETIKYLVKNKKVDFLVTTAGAVEEDLIKAMNPFFIGEFEAPGEVLLNKGVCRTGNIYVPNDRYLYFERFMNPVMNKVYQTQKERGHPLSTSEVIKIFGQEINNDESVLYWAAKNNIPVICPAIHDGSIGDLFYFQKKRNPDFAVDIVADMELISDRAMNLAKSGVILLGAGTAKHFVLNAQIFRDGADYAVYINTAQEFDGSDSGARIEEAITWAKVKPNAPSVKVHCDATIAFPLLVAETFKLERD